VEVAILIDMTPGSTLVGPSARRSWRSIVVVMTTLTLVAGGVVAWRLERTPQPIGPTGLWSLLATDEFTGDALDRGTWNDSEHWERAGRAADAAWLPTPATDRQLSVSDGVLSLHARRGQGLPEGRAFTSAHVNTRGRLELPAGATTFTEGRLDVPDGNGLLPQFWLLGQGDNSTGQGWPRTGEVDLLEMANANNGEFSHPYFSVWYPKDIYSRPPGTFGNGTHVTHPASFDRRPELFAGWHTWGLFRSPTVMELYLDGRKAFTFRPGEVYDNGVALPPMLFTNAMHLRLSLGVGGDWAGKDWSEDALQEGDLRVDYVRVWKQD
jgi:Glycosyl hydrolases family 16